MTETDAKRPIRCANWLASERDTLTSDEWDLMPTQYLGECEKGCYAPRVMVQGHPVEFGAYGVYVCTGCGYAYSPKFEPEMVMRGGKAVWAFRWDDDGNEINMTDWPEFNTEEEIDIGSQD